LSELNNMDQFGRGSEMTGSGHGMGPTFPSTLSNMKFMGVAGLVYGIMTCLSVLGAILGIPLIIASNRILESVKILEEYRVSGLQEDMALGIHELGRSFRLMKIVVLISLALIVLNFLFIFLFGGLALLSGLANA
jgi:Family of unknown function (DUF5362)